MQSHKRKDQGHLMEVSGQRIHFVLGFDLAHELKTKREIFQHLPQLVVGLRLLLLFERDLLLSKLWEVVISIPLLLIELILLIKMSNVRVCSLNIESLSSIFDFHNII